MILTFLPNLKLRKEVFAVRDIRFQKLSCSAFKMFFQKCEDFSPFIFLVKNLNSFLHISTSKVIAKKK